MADNSIMISLEEVSAAATKIANCNDQLTEKLDAISSAMASLSSTWQSEAGETIRAKMEGMRPIFEDYHEVIASYVTFLNRTVETYSETENSINSAASAFM